MLESVIGRLGARRRRLLAWRAMQATGVTSMVFERDGLVWHVPAFDDIAYGLFVEGGFQLPERRALVEWMRRSCIQSGPKNVIANVGAHVGSTCIPLVQDTGCRALAIEPILAHFRLLKANVEANGLGDRILLSNRAVLGTPGRVTMYRTTGNSGDNFVWRGEDPPAVPRGLAGQEQVDGNTLPAILDGAGLRLEEIALVWADVQGLEPELIESGRPLWEMAVPLFAEVEPHSLKRQGRRESFATLVAAHFDRFIDSRDMVRLGAGAEPVPIERLEALIAGITPEQNATDVLFLPPACRA
jgi:FkbM family methyltransferase